MERKDDRLFMAGTVASERHLTGIINLGDSFKATKSVDRLSSLDPYETVVRPNWAPQSCHPTAMP